MSALTSPKAARPARNAKPSGRVARVARHPTYDDPEKRHAMTAEAAYFLAEQRGFAPGHELEDWLAAEEQVRAQLALGEIPPPQGSR